MTHPDATVVRFEPLYGPPQRLMFEPREDGSYLRTRAEWNGCLWRKTGSEVVENVRLPTPGGSETP